RQRKFDVYGPKAVACIAGLPPALSSRTIHLMMFKCDAGSEKPKRRLDDNPWRWVDLRDSLHALTLGNGPKLLELARRRDLCPRMNGRSYELWQPLLALASWVEESGLTGLCE